jgi:4-hydroxyacetophenone monooxygenase
METMDNGVRKELLNASDEVIDDALKHADPMVLRGLLYQLTGDEEVASTETERIFNGIFDMSVVMDSEAVALLRSKTADFLKRYRDGGAGMIGHGPESRIAKSVKLTVDDALPEDDLGLWVEELALDPWARGLNWRSPPDADKLESFHVTVIGTGMGGLNAAIQLKRAGIKFTVIEKNAGVGGTWWENRYPGIRVDAASRSYTHLYGVNFELPNPFCTGAKNAEYTNWVADTFDVRKSVVFNTEVTSMDWNDQSGTWTINVSGPDGTKSFSTNAVISAVGFLSRPSTPEIAGAADFKGQSWHTARWPENFDHAGKRIAVIGTGCSGYQMIPELARTVQHVTVFQRTPSWLVEVPGYLSPYPPQVNWLERNVPFYANFMKLRASFATYTQDLVTAIDPEYKEDPNAMSAMNKSARDMAIRFLERKLKDPELVKKMTPPNPIFSDRPVIVDSEYSVLDAIQRENVTLVTEGIRRINATGIESNDGVQHDVDVIVYATGFRARDYLFPMKITGKNGMTLEERWKQDGPRAYKGTMIAGFPNLWVIYGPNTNGMINLVPSEEIHTRYALQCIEQLVLEDKRSINVSEHAYWRFGEEVDAANAKRLWSDERSRSYFWSEGSRTATQCPFSGNTVWRYLREVNSDDLELG